MNPFPPPADTKRRAARQFDGWATGYDRSILQALLFQPSYRALLTELWRLAQARPGEPLDVLDVGCGTAQFPRMALAADLARTAVGLDYAAAMVAQATACLGDLPAPFRSRLHLVRADGEHLPFADASFDFLSCANSFHHYPDQGQAIGEFRRVLRPGGRVVLLDGCRDSLIGFLVFDVGVNWAEGGVTHVSYLRARELMAGAGLRVISQRKMNVWCPVLLTVAEAPA